jgi:hypothetical protein
MPSGYHFAKVILEQRVSADGKFSHTILSFLYGRVMKANTLMDRNKRNGAETMNRQPDWASRYRRLPGFAPLGLFHGS